MERHHFKKMIKKTARKKKVFQTVASVGNLKIEAQGNQIRFNNSSTPEEYEVFLKNNGDSHHLFQKL